MGRSKTASVKLRSKESFASTSSSANGKKHSALDLLVKAEGILNSTDDVELAAQFLKRAEECLDSDEEKTKFCEVAGMLALETGDERQAKSFFIQCSASSSVSLLYLAQFADTPQESVNYFKGAVDLLSKQIDLQGGSYANGKDKAWSEKEREVREKICSALVAMTEMYLTDLCFEPDAEARCGEYLDLALRVDAGADLNPEIYSTLASVRLSQCRTDEARKALQKSYAIWAVLPPDSPRIPAYETRLNIVKLLIEVEDLESALDVLEALEEENDEDLEMLYLTGLVNNMTGQKEQDGTAKKEVYVDGRVALDRFLLIASRKPEDVIDEMMQQVQELICDLESKGITSAFVESELANAAIADGAEGWEDIDDDDEDQEMS